MTKNEILDVHRRVMECKTGITFIPRMSNCEEVVGEYFLLVEITTTNAQGMKRCSYYREFGPNALWSKEMHRCCSHRSLESLEIHK